jgi:hypothetical protein
MHDLSDTVFIQVRNITYNYLVAVVVVVVVVVVIIIISNFRVFLPFQAREFSFFSTTDYNYYFIYKIYLLLLDYPTEVVAATTTTTTTTTITL